MNIVKIADEVYELQGWEPPAKKPSSAPRVRRIAGQAQKPASEQR